MKWVMNSSFSTDVFAPWQSSSKLELCSFGLTKTFLKVRFLAKPKRINSLWSFGLTKSFASSQQRRQENRAKMQHLQGIPVGPVEQSISIGLTSREALHAPALYAPTICPCGASKRSARQAYEIRPVVTVVGITIATFANAMLSYIVSVVVNNNPRARQAFCKTPFLACYLIRKA